MLRSHLRSLARPMASVPLAAPAQAASRRHSSSFTLNSYLVSPGQLDAALKKNVHSKLSVAPKVIPLCASWFLPNDGRDGYETYKASRIPHARFFDLDAVKDAHSPYPHMLPDGHTFARAMSRLGIRRDDDVVVYDSAELGIFSAPRVAWTLLVFGHPNVHVLNNFRLWKEQGYPIESGEPKEVDVAEYPVTEADQSKVIAFEKVREIARDLGKEGAEEVQILDARSKGRFDGTEPEPREGMFTYGLTLDSRTDKCRPRVRTHSSLRLGPRRRPS
jgi:thiosulfate/3-mercaptopyruvate sulfurtransferase